MSIPCQILFKPRPHVPSLRTAWIPAGLAYAPIHLSHQDPPPELKKEWELLDFNCSVTLDRYLVEFHQHILPLPIMLDESIDTCTQYVQLESGVHSQCVQILVDFRRRTMEEMVGWWRSLPKALAKEKIPDLRADLDDETVSKRFRHTCMLSMDNSLIELKSWVCMFHQVDNWLRRWPYHQQRVYDRHAEPHLLCTADYRLLYHDTSKLIASLALRFGASLTSLHLTSLLKTLTALELKFPTAVF
ncbi:hypothetical protein B0H16DRAFT_1689601 [Mycena metata]|uniref:Uncharacterized protein n=1 Tax=Mycena metata TaxID=1033252 RepID=A0AAD7J758_9AGAR|nr:hypothetical protein B0H16DRAFT_1689601 [Mycena metata]